MRVYNPQSNQTLLPELREALTRLRRRRGFDAGRYVRAKGSVLNFYLENARLNACVVGVSGGIDSAVVLGLAAHAKLQHDSPLQKIVAVLMPIFDVGATHQSEAANRGREVSETFGVEPVLLDLSSAHSALKTAVDTALNVTGEAWASGQLVSYARTPALYYITSLLTQQGDSGVLLGTTNRDEGGYLGFIGKASDAMVDVQLISDLHKSEVRKVAEFLSVPASVMQATPTGDMYDGRADEEVFGAPYDFVELYLLYKDLTLPERDGLQEGWSGEAKNQFQFFAHNLEELHRYNCHKYLGKSPAVHLDILHAATPGGWNNSLYLTHSDPPVNTAKINALFNMDANVVDKLNRACTPDIEKESLLDLADSALLLKIVFTEEEVAAIRSMLEGVAWVPVGLDGMKQNYNPETDAIGSWRATAYAPTFARTLWNRIGGTIGSPRIMNDATPTDWDDTPVWRAVGINPVLRFIRYEAGNRLIPHYDSPFVYHEGKRTLASVILYLEGESGAGGATRFIADPQAHLPIAERDLADWTRFADESEVLLCIPPHAGSCLVFDHRILHDSELYSGTTPKIILRTDVIFERCGTVPSDV